MKIVNLQKWKKNKLSEFEKQTTNSTLEIVLNIDVNPARFDVKPTCEFWTDDEVMCSRLLDKRNQKIFLSYLADWFYNYSEHLGKDKKVDFVINLYDD